jgi:hypothetical protein
MVRKSTQRRKRSNDRARNAAAWRRGWVALGVVSRAGMKRGAGVRSILQEAVSLGGQDLIIRWGLIGVTLGKGTASRGPMFGVTGRLDEC